MIHHRSPDWAAAYLFLKSLTVLNFDGITHSSVVFTFYFHPAIRIQVAPFFIVLHRHQSINIPFHTETQSTQLTSLYFGVQLLVIVVIQSLIKGTTNKEKKSSKGLCN